MEAHENGWTHSILHTGGWNHFHVDSILSPLLILSYCWINTSWRWSWGVVLNSKFEDQKLCFVTTMDCSPPGSSVHGILQVRILEWVAIPFSRGSSWPRDGARASCTAGRFFTIWATSKSHRGLEGRFKKKNHLFKQNTHSWGQAG